MARCSSTSALMLAALSLFIVLLLLATPTHAVPLANHTLYSVDSLPLRFSASCTYDIHTNALSPRAWLTAGVNGTTGALTSETFLSTSAFLSSAAVTRYPAQPIMNTGAPFLPRTSASMVLLGNGNLILFGGATGPSSSPTTPSPLTYIDVVYASSDAGLTWSQSTNDAAWTVRASAAACAVPGTNRIVMCGGQTPSGTPLNECWTSTDGVGDVWTLQSSSAPFSSALVGGACVAGYDSTLYGGANANSTLFVVFPSGVVMRSSNYGSTFVSVTSIPFNPAATATANTLRLSLAAVMDRSNNLYVFGGSGGTSSVSDGNVYMSTDMGATWSVLQTTTGTTQFITQASTPCMSLWYSPTSSSSSMYNRVLSVYGGGITTTGSVAVRSAQIVLSNEPVSLPTVWAPALPSYDVSQMPTANHTQAVPDIIPWRRYPSCAYDIHTSALVPRMFYTAGQNNTVTTALNGDSFMSTDGWQSAANVTYFPRQPILNTGANFLVRRAGGMVYLANGNLVMFGGKTLTASGTDGNVYVDLVYYSTDYGRSWWQSTNDAAWTVRSDMAYCAMPGTNRILMCGGQMPVGSNTECWASTDGIGAVWTQQSTGQFPGFSGGACVGLYDSTLYGGPNANNTMLLISPTGVVSLTRDYGVTFLSSIATVPFVSSSSRGFLNAVADRLSNVYVLGGSNVIDSNVYYSPNDGYTWYRLSAVAGNANSAIMTMASTSCAAMMLTPVASSSQTTQYYNRELIVYGGQISLSTGAAAESTRITLSGTPTALPTVWPAPLPSYDASQMPTANHTQSVSNLVPVRRYASCAYDIHTNASTPRMFYIAGQTGTTTTAQNGDTYMSVDGFQSTAGITYFSAQPIVNTGAPFVVRRAGGTVFLANGNLVMFGGKTVSGSDANVYVDLVYYSSDYGRSWWQATNDAAWSVRSDFAYCAMPGTNRIMMCGGQLTGSNQECWTSTDGVGIQWTLQSTGQFPGFSGGTCVGLYDSTLYGGPNPNSTLLVISPTGVVSLSRNYGVTFLSSISTIPFISTASRSFLTAVADRSSNIYVFGGLSATDGNVYYSPNDGYSWYRLAPVAGNANSAVINVASSSCLAMFFTPVASSSLSTQYFTRDLVVYGGTITLSSGASAASSRITLTGAPVSLPTVWPNPLPPYTLTSALPFANHTLSLPTILPARNYPSCAWDIHTNSTMPRMWISAGQNGSVGTAVNSDTYMSVDGWQTLAGVRYFSAQNITNTGAAFIPRRAGSMVHLANGNLVLFGGKTLSTSGADANVYIDVVYYSTNQGASWAQATNDAAWTVRSDMTSCAIPGTNRIILVGGQMVNSTVSDEVWTTTDGIGRDWSLQSTGQVIAFQSGACAGLYDSTLYGGTSVNSTLIVITNGGIVYSSTDYGRTMRVVSGIPFTPAGNRNGMSLAVDRSNNLYVVGGQGVADGDVYYSPDNGVSWYTLFPLDSNANGGVISVASSSCLGLWYSLQSTSSQNTRYYTRQLAVYGGVITLADNTAAESVQIALTNAPVTLPTVWPAPMPAYVEGGLSSSVAPLPSSSVRVPSSSVPLPSSVPTPTPSSSVPATPPVTPSSSVGGAVIVPSSSVSAPASGSSSTGVAVTDAASSGSSLSGGAIAGIVVAVVVCALIVIAVVCFWSRTHKAKLTGAGGASPATRGAVPGGLSRSNKAESYSHHDDEQSAVFENEVEMAEHGETVAASTATSAEVAV